MAKGSRRRRGSFLSNFRLDDAYLLRPDRKRGIPGILSGIDSDGNPILVKVWPKPAGTDDSELHEIWHSEVRQMHRLGGYPTAAETIVTLQHAGEDESGFYLILDPGQRRPLATILAHAHAGHWLKNQRRPQNRTLLWHNLLRMSAGLEILHTQGLLHKNFNEWAIVTTGETEPDFQLTGFEWSVRLVGAALSRPPERGRDKRSSEPTSFLHDWRDFGLLAAQLMEVPIRALGDPKIPHSGVCEHMSVAEIRLLRDMIQFGRLDRLDGEVIKRRIQDVLRALEAEVANKDIKLHLVVGVGPTSRLSRAIREASNDEIEMDAIEDQLNFVTDDLDGSSIIIGVKSEFATETRLVIQGRKLLYSLNAFMPTHKGATATWEFAHCNSCEDKSPASVNVKGSVTLEPNSLTVLANQEARHRFSRSRGKVRNWEAIRSQFESTSIALGRDEQFHRALALTQLLEALYAATDAFPVEVVEEGEGEVPREDMVFLRIKTRGEPERDALSDALGMEAPARRFQEILIDDQRGDDWILTEAQQVGVREHTDTSWRFDGIEQKDGGAPTFRFVGSEPPVSFERAVMVAGDALGRDIQFRRRLKALRALADHDELLWMLVDPRRRILDSHEGIPNDAMPAELDTSKKKALSATIGTLPLYLIQGPPGVGKTRLVRELVRYALVNDSTSRLLLTAQSNAAVDHLVDTLREDLSSIEEDLVVIRCRARDRGEETGPYEIDAQVRETITRFAQSQLVAEASPNLRESIEALAESANERIAANAGTRSRENAERIAMQAVEGLIVRSANVVFSTANSRELERLNDERAQLDWSIVEEAGKAMGGELISPLLLSYRRLMIGDHKQLSPFGSTRIIKLLERPETVAEAIQAGHGFVARTLRDSSTDEVLDDIREEDGDAVAELCTVAMDCLHMFEGLIDREFAVQARNAKARPIAHRLDVQHRMHPAIARLVSSCFYEDRLITHPAAEDRFNSAQCPIKSADSKQMPNAPITVVAMPYIQSTPGMREGERSPRWHNPSEVDAVANVVRLLRINCGETPSLAILSPYSEQVRRLKTRIEENLQEFEELSRLRPAVGPSSYCGTVDSFQGNEADVVVVSLVRNNHHASARSALGFLTDCRRMNVLLSRARWRLIIVCSLEFLRNILEVAQSLQTEHDVAFLAKMLECVERERKSGNAVVIPVERVAGERGR